MNIYRLQLFIFTLIISFILFQFTLLMEDTGISVYTALTIFTFAQVLIMITTFVLKILVDKGVSPLLLVRISLFLRIFAISLMIIISNIYIFITAFLIYRLSMATNILFEGLLVQKTQKENTSFGTVRMFGSIGFSSGGLVTAGVVAIFGQISHLLILMLILDAVNLSISFIYPIKIEEKQEKVKKNVKISKKGLIFIFLCAIVLAFADSFNIILNHQYIYRFNLVYYQAIFWGGIAVLFSAFISEVPAMLSVERFIKKLGTLKIVMIGFLLSIVRWIIALIAPNHVIFTSTYLFHGIAFSFIFLGMIAHFKDSEFAAKVVLTFTLIASVLTLVSTQSFSFILAHLDAIYILIAYAIIHILVSIIFYWKFCRVYKEEGKNK